jgi:hypothetical protein
MDPGLNLIIDTIFKVLEIGALIGAAAVILVRFGKKVEQAMTSNTLVLTTRLDGVERRFDHLEADVKKMGEVLIILAEQKGEIKLLRESQILQGKRVDEVTNRFNNWVDTRDTP